MAKIIPRRESGQAVQKKSVTDKQPTAVDGHPSVRHGGLGTSVRPNDEIIEKQIPVKTKKGLFRRLSEIGTIPQREIVEFTRHLYVMLSAGVTIFEAVKFLKDQTKNRIFRSRLESVLFSLNNGQSLSAAMRRFPRVFQEVYVNIITVGEQSGSLPETMKDLADNLEEGEKFKSRIKGALIYPKIILSVMITFILVLVLFVMPRILTIFESLKAEIPLATRVIMKMTSFINENILYIILLIMAIILVCYVLLKNSAVRKWLDFVYIKIPMIGHIVLNYNTAQISQHFGTLFNSGITVVKCLEITKNAVSNRIFKDEIGYMVDKIKRGASLSGSFQKESYFPPMFIKLIKVGERTGKLPHVIEYMKDYYKSLVDNDVKNITTIIEPAIMALLGLMVAGIVITVIGPIYQLISNVGK